MPSASRSVPPPIRQRGSHDRTTARFRVPTAQLEVEKPPPRKGRRARIVAGSAVMLLAVALGVYLLVLVVTAWRKSYQSLVIVDLVLVLIGLMILPRKTWREEVREHWGDAAPEAEKDPLGLSSGRKPGWNALRIAVAGILFGVVTSLFLALLPRLITRGWLASLYLAPVMVLSLVWLIIEFRQRMGDPPVQGMTAVRRRQRRLKRGLARLRGAFWILALTILLLLGVWNSLGFHRYLRPLIIGVLCVSLIFVWWSMRQNMRRLRITWVRDPRIFRVTTFGWFHSGMTVAVGILALQTGRNLVYLLFAVMIGVILASGVMATMNFRRLSVKRRLPEEVFARTPVALRVDVSSGRRWMPALSLWLQEGWPPEVERPKGHVIPYVYALSIPPRGATGLDYAMEFPQRGRFVFRGFNFMTRFPFSLFTRYHYLRCKDEVLVFPRLRELPAGLIPTGDARLAETQRTRPHGRGQDDFRGLRSYIPGADEPRRIHWPTSARTLVPMVREYERETEGPRWVFLENTAPGPLLETAIEWAASLIDDAYRHGLGFTLIVPGWYLAGEPSAEPAHRRHCLEILARMPGSPDQPDPRLANAIEQDGRFPIHAGAVVIGLATTDDEAFSQWFRQVTPPQARRVLHRITLDADEATASSPGMQK